MQRRLTHICRSRHDYGLSGQSVTVSGVLIDPELIAAFWQRGQGAAAIPVDRLAPDAVERFGDSAELADELLALLLDGAKRATAGSLAAFEREGAPLPSVGDHWVVEDATLVASSASLLLCPPGHAG